MVQLVCGYLHRPGDGILGHVLALAVAIYLGAHGHGLAWRYRRFANFAQFEDTMAAWNMNGLILFVVGVIIAAILLLVQLSLYIYRH